MSDGLDALTDSQRALVEEMVAAMRTPLEASASEDTDVVDGLFLSTFGDFLRLHHAIYEGPLNKEAFEYVFMVANRAAGRVAVRNASRGSATHDIAVDGVKWSLKTEAGARVNPRRAYVAKFTEARWIREATNPAECAAAMSRVVDHMGDYERIGMLRGLQREDRVDYELIELPREAIARLADLPHGAFTKEGSKRSYGADLRDQAGDRVLRILLDSSVEKVRLWFEVDACRVHARWSIPVRA